MCGRVCKYIYTNTHTHTHRLYKCIVGMHVVEECEFVCVCVCRFSYDLLTCVSRGSARDEPKNNYSNNNHPKCKFTDHAAAAGDGLAGRHAELPDCLRCGHTHSHTGCLLFHLFSFIFCQPKGGGIVLSMFYVFNP